MSELTKLMTLLSKLVSIPSSSGSEHVLADYIFNWLIDAGLHPKRQTTRDGRHNIIMIMRGKGASRSSPKILFGGHIDTVLPSHDWPDPLELKIKKDGYAYGLGSADMKAGLACLLWLAKKIKESNVHFWGEIWFAFFVDEESYSVGAHDFVQELTEKIDFAILAEPHFYDIVIGAPGKALIELTFSGLKGHAAEPTSGINSIDIATDLLHNLRLMLPSAGKDNFGSYSVLDIQTNVKKYSLTIPDYCKVIINKQLETNESVYDFIEVLKRLFVQKVGKGSLTVNVGLPNYLPHQVDKYNKFLKSLCISAKNHQLESRLVINSGVSDANILNNDASIPTVLFGPAGEFFHTSNERVEIDSLLKYISILMDFIVTVLKDKE